MNGMQWLNADVENFERMEARKPRDGKPRPRKGKESRERRQKRELKGAQ